MSAPRAIAELVVSSIRIFGKAMAAAGRQAAANARHKPDDSPDAGPVGGKSKSQITNQLAMSVEEAHMILNVKKEESMEKILESYERIFAANGPPKPAPEPAAGTPPTHGRAKPKQKGPTHSHYLQSKVYRALERIKAERSEEIAASSEAAAEGAAEGAPAEAAKAEAGKAEAGAEGAKGEQKQ